MKFHVRPLTHLFPGPYNQYSNMKPMKQHLHKWNRTHKYKPNTGELKVVQEDIMYSKENKPLNDQVEQMIQWKEISKSVGISYSGADDCSKKQEPGYTNPGQASQAQQCHCHT